MAKPKKQFLVEKCGPEKNFLIIHAVALTEAYWAVKYVEGTTWVMVLGDIINANINPLYDIDEIKAEIEEKLAAGSETVPEVFNE